MDWFTGARSSADILEYRLKNYTAEDRRPRIILRKKTLRPAVHCVLRAADRRRGQLARPANAEAGRRATILHRIARANSPRAGSQKAVTGDS